ncbi:MAG: hypothetical protein P8J66_05465 [Verrucomicrobiota bacterium]|nr:hypothetical protein [Verrucomicrobiota bacterium]
MPKLFVVGCIIVTVAGFQFKTPAIIKYQRKDSPAIGLGIGDVWLVNYTSAGSWLSIPVP